LIPPFFGRNFDKAEAFIRKTIQQDPRFPDPYVRLAQLYLFKGQKDQYEKYIDKALELDPLNELALDIKNRTCRFICLTEVDQ